MKTITETAALKRDMWTQYKITKTLSGGCKSTYMPVKEHGNMISSKAEMSERTFSEGS